MNVAAQIFAPVRIEDVAELAALMQQAFPQAYGEGWSAAQLRGVLSLPQVGGERLLQDDKLVGFSLFRQVADEAELLLVAVLPALRGQGLGRQLVDRVATAALAGGAASLFLEVRDGNQAAQRLYGHMGFAPIGQRKAYYRGADGQPHDAVTMRLDLRK